MLSNLNGFLLCNYFFVAFLLLSNDFICLSAQEKQPLASSSAPAKTSSGITTTPHVYDGDEDSSANKSGLGEDDYVYVDDNHPQNPIDIPREESADDADVDTVDDNEPDLDADNETISHKHEIILNYTNANMFKSWIDGKSRQLYALNTNYSGFKLLNQTYTKHLLKDAKFAWIDFTKMIVNISKTISQVKKRRKLI